MLDIVVELLCARYVSIRREGVRRIVELLGMWGGGGGGSYGGRLMVSDVYGSMVKQGDDKKSYVGEWVFWNHEGANTTVRI